LIICYSKHSLRRIGLSRAFGVSLDCLAGEATSVAFDRKTAQNIEKQEADEGEHAFVLLDAFLVKNKM